MNDIRHTHRCSRCGIEKKMWHHVGKVRSCPVDACSGTMRRSDSKEDKRIVKAKQELQEFAR